MNPTPISLIVDDPCPGMHIYRSHAARRDPRAQTADGRTGRIRDLLVGGGEVVLCTHWQSLFSNGTMTGLAVLGEVARRVREQLGDAVRWVKCSEVAAAAVARSEIGHHH